MQQNNKSANNNKKNNKKTATDNKWVSTGVKPFDNRERRDGPGGDNSKN